MKQNGFNPYDIIDESDVSENNEILNRYKPK